MSIARHSTGYWVRHYLKSALGICGRLHGLLLLLLLNADDDDDC